MAGLTNFTHSSNVLLSTYFVPWCEPHGGPDRHLPHGADGLIYKTLFVDF